MHGGVTTAIKGFPETPCPYSNVAGDHNDELLKAKADAFVQQAVHTIMSSRAWTGNSVIFVTADESDYDGSDSADNYYLSTAGCCDSPYLPAGDPEISPKWPGGLSGSSSAIADVDSAGPAADIGRRWARHLSWPRIRCYSSSALASLLRTASTSACSESTAASSLTEFLP